uniref:Uncharacterized protein n=1 Tax=Rhizophora mucronata TaxID=61149 RepID=A0A2P2PBN9_RHIMU
MRTFHIKKESSFNKHLRKEPHSYVVFHPLHLDLIKVNTNGLHRRPQ